MVVVVVEIVACNALVVLHVLPLNLPCPFENRRAPAANKVALNSICGEEPPGVHLLYISKHV